MSAVDELALLEYLDGLSPEDRAKVREELLLQSADAARKHLLPFIHLVRPNFQQGRHHEVLAEHLEAVEAGDLTRLMVFMPPRSGKSFIISETYPAWWLGRHPAHQVMSISYKDDLSTNFGREVRDLIASPQYQALYPNTRIRSNHRSAQEWGTTSGGRYYAAGAGSGIAGRGCHLGLIDDPMNEQDADSEAALKRINNWYGKGFRTRLMANGRIIILMTRWHDMDLAGKLLEEANEDISKDQWKVLSIPALLDEEGSKLIGYPVGTSYWPPAEDLSQEVIDEGILTGWTTEALLTTKQELGPRAWNALYMQKPSADGGNILKREYWQDWPQAEAPACFYKIMSVDTAYETTDSADFSAITLWGLFHDKAGRACMILLAAKKGRWEFSELKSKITEMQKQHNPDLMIIEKKASGISLVQELVKSGYPVYPYKPDRSKVSRAWAAQPMFQSKRVFARLNTPAAEAVIEECARFPVGKKDFVDTVTQVVQWLRENMLIVQDTDPWGEPGFENSEDDFEDDPVHVRHVPKGY